MVRISLSRLLVSAAVIVALCVPCFAQRPVDSVADLPTTSVADGGYAIVPGVRGGLFRFDAGSSATVDSGIVFNGPAGRFTREWDGTNVDVRWFGATPDDATDDSAAIIAAIATGRTIHFPAGVYDTDTQLDIDVADVNFNGVGRQGTIRAITGASGKMFDVGVGMDGVRFIGIKIDLNQVAQVGIFFGDNCEDGLLDNCEIFGGEAVTSLTAGVQVSNECHRLTVRNCHIHDFDDTIGSDQSVRGILFNGAGLGCKDVKIHNNTIEHIYDSEGDNGGTVDADGVVFQDQTGEGLAPSISKNNIRDCRGRCIKMQIGGALIDGNILHQQAGNMWIVNQVLGGSTISNNVCTGLVSDIGIGLFDNDVCSGNTLTYYDALATPVALTVDTGTDTFTSVGHGLVDREFVTFEAVVFPTGISDGVFYIVLNATADTFQVAADVPDYLSNTQIDVSTTGTTVEWRRGGEPSSDAISVAASGPRSGFSIVNNTIVNAPRHAIHFEDDVTAAIVSGNQIIDAGDDASSGYGINCTGLLNNSVIDGNAFESSQDKDIGAVNGGDHNVISNNVFSDPEDDSLWIHLDNSQIIGNTWTAVENDTIHLQNCDHLTIAGNKFDQPGEATADQQILVSGGACTFLAVRDNVFTDIPSPVMQFSSATDNLTIEDNIFRTSGNFSAGVLLFSTGCDFVNVRNNTFHDVPVPVAKYAAACKNVVISDNIFDAIRRQTDDTTGIVELDTGVSDSVVVKDNRVAINGGDIDSVSTGGDTLTDVSHGMSNDDVVVLTLDDGGSMPAPLIESQRYYVLGAAADTFQVSLVSSDDSGQSAIDITTAGSGVNWHSKQNFVRNNTSSTRVVVHGNRTRNNSVLNWLNGGIETWATVYDNFYDQESQLVDVNRVELHVDGMSRITLDGLTANNLYALTGGVDGQIIDVYVDDTYTLHDNHADARAGFEFYLTSDVNFSPGSSKGFIRLLYNDAVAPSGAWVEINRTDF